MEAPTNHPQLASLLDFSRPKAFIFDLDDTLVDSVAYHAAAFRQTLKELAPDCSSIVDENLLRGRGSPDVFISLGITDLDLIAKLTRDKRRRYLQFIHEGRVRPIPGALDLLSMLKSRRKILILVTSASEETARASLEAAGIRQYFDYVVTAEQAVEGKPSSDLYERALRCAQVPPSEAVTIEDAEIGIQGSRLANVAAVLVNQPTFPKGIPAFQSLYDLYERIRSDLEKAGGPGAAAIQDILLSDITVDVWDPRLGERPPNYDPRSDHELLKLFEIAADRRESVRLLRIGCPLLFRRQILAVLDDTGSREGSPLDALLDARIPSIQILLADPDGIAFLGRLDYERAGSWGIWRVRHEVLRLAKGLAELAKHRQDGELEVGFHRGELIWNIGIIGQGNVLVRAYAKSSGHDVSVESQWLSTGQRNYFAESFISFWHAISKQTTTRWLASELVDLYAPPRWPSLYKGNAVLARERDFDKEDFGTAISKQHVQKICRSPEGQEAERKWLLINDEQRSCLKYFRPVGLVRQHPRKVPRVLCRAPLVMERIQGISLFEVASAANVAGQVPEQTQAAAHLLGELLSDSLGSLTEFRQLAHTVLPPKLRKKYPYGQKVESALDEVKSFVGPLSSAALVQAIDDARALGEDLEAKATVPFRDAHLKNRIWVTNEAIHELIGRLLTLDQAHIQAEVCSRIMDIDFETSGYNVTEWDDVVHLLFFEKSGTGPFVEQAAVPAYEMWWGPIQDESALWCTTLARSTRELCRRLWYARIMPNTYFQRYGMESRDYFVDLALFAAEQIDGFARLRELLRGIKENPEVWAGIGQERTASTIKASLPADAAWRSHPSPYQCCAHDVFIAHNSKDKSSVRVLVKALEQRGVRPWLDEQEIPPGRWFQDIIQAEAKRAKSAAIILGPSGLGKWEALELRIFVEQCVSRDIPVMPVLLAGVDQIPEELVFLCQLTHVKFNASPDEPENIDHLCWGITGRKSPFRA